MKLNSYGSRTGRRACVWGPCDPCIGGRRRSRCKSVFRNDHADVGLSLPRHQPIRHRRGTPRFGRLRARLGSLSRRMGVKHRLRTVRRHGHPIEIDFTAGFDIALERANRRSARNSSTTGTPTPTSRRAIRSTITMRSSPASRTISARRRCRPKSLGPPKTFGEGGAADGVHGRPRSSALWSNFGSSTAASKDRVMPAINRSTTTRLLDYGLLGSRRDGVDRQF